MSLQLRQNLKLAQQLVMTPQLQQAIKLLQLSRVELLETMQQAMLENPLLEEKQNEEDTESENSQIYENEAVQEVDVKESDLLRNAEWDDYIGVFSSSSRQTSEREIPEEVVSYEAFYAAKPSLQSHLYWQLYLSDISEENKKIGEQIIESLDSNGYLNCSLEELVQLTGFSSEKVETMLKRIQKFDPIGVASRNLQECLCTQLEFLGYQDSLLKELVNNHLGELEKQNYSALTKTLNVSMNKLMECFAIIKSLEPRPGSSFTEGETFYISPDAYVYKYDQEFVIILNDDGFPELQLSHYYLEEMDNSNAKEKDYLQDKMREAIWLMKSIHQRQRTLYKVLESLVKFQRDFFENGIDYLKPLVLKDVAEDIEVHESTVSRITTNKYVSTPLGIFELKFFFNSGLGKNGGGQVSSESVKSAIKKILHSEDPKKPYSDEKLSAMLFDKLQVNIARRTVAKYREAMNIPSSSKRKRRY